MPSAAAVERHLRKRSPLGGLVAPAYDGLSVANLAQSILQAAGAPARRPLAPAWVDPAILKDAKHIVLVMVDGLGWMQLPKSLRKLEGIPITSVLPSTTTVAFPSLATGLTPQEHGLVGYWVYFRELDDVCSMLRFGPAQGMGSYADVGIDPSLFFPFPTIYQLLRKQGYQTHHVTKREFADSALSQMLYNGAEMVGVRGISDLFPKAHALLGKGKHFVSIYYEGVDIAAHVHGGRSRQARQEAERLAAHLETFLDKIKDAVILVTADHGQMDCPEKAQVSYADHPELLARLASPPSGEGRCSYLFAKKGRVEQVRDYAEQHFGKLAHVLESRALLERGLLGTGKPFPETSHRIGDITLIPKGNQVFTYPYLEGRGIAGFHGGLSAEEMLVPLLWKRV